MLEGIKLEVLNTEEADDSDVMDKLDARKRKGNSGRGEEMIAFSKHMET